jgi:hypothetical protein
MSGRRARRHGRRAQVHGRRSARRTLRAPAAVALVAALALGGAATASAVFLAQDTAVARSRAGAVTLDWNAGGVNQFTVPVTGLTPGGTAARLIDLRNTGTVAASALQLAVAAPVVGASASDGLQFALDRCSVAWSSVTACSGTITAVSVDRPAGGRVALGASAALAVGGTDHLRVTFRLPDSAPTAARSTSGTVTFTVTGVQVAGRQR